MTSRFRELVVTRGVEQSIHFTRIGEFDLEQPAFFIGVFIDDFGGVRDTVVHFDDFAGEW